MINFRKVQFILLSLGLVTLQAACSSDDATAPTDPTLPVIPVNPVEPKTQAFAFDGLKVVQSTAIAGDKQTEVPLSAAQQMQLKYLAPVKLTLVDKAMTIEEHDGTLTSYTIEQKEDTIYVSFDAAGPMAFAKYSKDKKQLIVRSVLYDWRGFNEQAFTTVTISGSSFGAVTLEESLAEVEHLQERKGSYVVGEFSYQLQ